MMSVIQSSIRKGRMRNLSSYLIDGSLKDLTFVSLTRAHLRGGNQLGKLIDKCVLLRPSSFFVKALVTENNQNAKLIHLRSQVDITFFINSVIKY